METNRPGAGGNATGLPPSGPVPPDLERVLRWEDSGGGWRVARIGGGSLTLSLVTCDGGEEMGVLTSTDPSLIAHVAGRSRHP